MEGISEIIGEAICSHYALQVIIEIGLRLIIHQ
jgi:hypothetical protein